MTIWGVLKNIGLVISFFKSMSGMIGGVAKTKEMPTKAELIDLLNKAEALLDSGAIDIEGVDEKAISEALKQIEAQLNG